MLSPKIDKASSTTARRPRSRQPTAQLTTQPSSSTSTTPNITHHATMRDCQAMLEQLILSVEGKNEQELKKMLSNSLATNVEQFTFIRDWVFLHEREESEAAAEARRSKDLIADIMDEYGLMKQELDDCRSEISSLKATIQHLDTKLKSDKVCRQDDNATIIQLQDELSGCTQSLKHATSDLAEAAKSEYDAYHEYLGSKHDAIAEYEHDIHNIKIQTVLWQELQQALVHVRHWEDKNTHTSSALNQCMKQLIASRNELMHKGAEYRNLKELFNHLGDHLRTYTENNMTLHARVRDTAEANQELQSLLQQAKGVNHGTERVIRKHKQEAEMYKQQLLPHQQKEQELSATIFDLEERLEESQRSEKAIRKEWKVAREHLKYLEADKRIIAGKSDALIKARDELIIEKEETLASTTQQLHTTQQELQTAQAQAQDTKTSEDLLAHLDSLQSQLDESTADNAHISRDLAVRDIEARNFTAQLAEAEQDLYASRSARKDIARQKELDAEFFAAEQHRLLSRVSELENNYMKVARKVEALGKARNQLTHALDRLDASNDRLTNDLVAQKIATKTDMHEAQTTIRRLQDRVHHADANSTFWANALSDGVGMPTGWKLEIERMARRKGGRNSNDARVLQESKLASVAFRVRGLLAENEVMSEEIEMLRGAAAAAAENGKKDASIARMGLVQEENGDSRVEDDMSSEQMEEQVGRFAEVYESLGGNVGEAVRQTLSERSGSSAGSRAGETGSVEEEEEEVEVIAPVLARRASWS